jgi:riboflavin biosynthesis pyrimidine reductase
VGGPALAAHAIRAGLVDEYQLLIAPIIAGSGNTFGTERKADDAGDTVHLRSGVPANKALHLTGPA